MFENQILPETEVPVAPVEILHPIDADGAAAASPSQESEFAETGFGNEPPEILNFEGLLAGAQTAATEAGVDAIFDVARVLNISDFQLEKLIRVLAKSTAVDKAVLRRKWNYRAKCMSVGPLTAGQRAAQAQAQIAAEAQTQAAVDAAKAEAWKKCEHIAVDPNLLPKMLNLIERLGVVNDKRGVLATYLTLTSRVLHKEVLSLLRTGTASSGKSLVITKTCMLFTEDDDYIITSGGSPKSLFYFGDGEDALKHKAVIIPEAQSLVANPNGSEEFGTALRTLISENRLDYTVTLLQENGPPKAERIRRNGPIAAIITSARDNVEAELGTRLIQIGTDESDAQQRAVLNYKFRSGVDPNEAPVAEIEAWRALQTHLRLGAPHSVEIPYSHLIVQHIPHGMDSRIMRDADAILATIKSSATLHQAQRMRDKWGRIVADIRDYKAVDAAFGQPLAEMHGIKVSPNIARVRTVVGGWIAAAAAANKSPPDAVQVSARLLKSALPVASHQTALARLYAAVDLGLLVEIPHPYAHHYGPKEPHWYKLGITPAQTGVIPPYDVLAAAWTAEQAAAPTVATAPAATTEVA